MNWRGRGPLLTAAVAELGAALAVLAGSHTAVALTGTDLSGTSKVALACTVAGVIALTLRAGIGWAAFLALLPAALVGALALKLPIWVPALCFGLLFLLLRNSLVERVPLYLSNSETLEALTRWMPADKPIRAVDLGCGLADVSLAMAQHNTHPASRFDGVENAPIPFAIAWARARLRNDARITIRWGSLWDEDLSGFDTVYAFLSPHPMPRLFDKSRKEMLKGSVFISNSFAVPDQNADMEIPIESGRATALLVWHMKGQKSSQS